LSFPSSRRLAARFGRVGISRGGTPDIRHVQNAETGPQPNQLHFFVALAAAEQH